MDVDFEAPLWRWEGEAAWYFISLPPDVSDEIEDRFGGGPGFGAVKVTVQVGASTWSTSLFPSTQHETYLLPVKKQVRVREQLDEGDPVQVHLHLAD